MYFTQITYFSIRGVASFPSSWRWSEDGTHRRALSRLSVHQKTMWSKKKPCSIFMKMAAFHWLRNIHIVCPKHSSPFLLHTTTDEPKKAEIFCRLSIRSFTDFSCPSRLNRPPAAQRPMGRGGVSYSADVDCPTEGTPLRSAARARQGRYSELLSIFTCGEAYRSRRAFYSWSVVSAKTLKY